MLKTIRVRIEYEFARDFTDMCVDSLDVLEVRVVHEIDWED